MRKGENITWARWIFFHVNPIVSILALSTFENRSSISTSFFMDSSYCDIFLRSFTFFNTLRSYCTIFYVIDFDTSFFNSFSFTFADKSTTLLEGDSFMETLDFSIKFYWATLCFFRIFLLCSTSFKSSSLYWIKGYDCRVLLLLVFSSSR